MRVLLVDDHSLFRSGLKTLLTSVDQFNEILEVNSGQSALAFFAEDDDIDVVLLDYELGDMHGSDILTHVKSEHPEIPVIMLSGREDASLIQQLLNNGASGFITKTSEPEVMLSAINLVLSGGVYVPPAMLLGASNPVMPPTEGQNITAQSSSESNTVPSELTELLTDRQIDVLRELSKGLSNKEVARILSISPSTVKVHVAAILKELGAKNRTVAVTMAKDMGLLNLTSG